MAETHLISGLVTTRAELSGELERLRRQINAVQVDLVAIDRVLRVVGYSSTPSAIKPIERRPSGYRLGSSANMMVDILRETGQAFPHSDLTKLIMRANGRDDSDRNAYLVAHKRVGAILRQLRDKGIVKRLGEGAATTWCLAP